MAFCCRRISISLPMEIIKTLSMLWPCSCWPVFLFMLYTTFPHSGRSALLTDGLVTGDLYLSRPPELTDLICQIRFLFICMTLLSALLRALHSPSEAGLSFTSHWSSGRSSSTLPSYVAPKHGEEKYLRFRETSLHPNCRFLPNLFNIICTFIIFGKPS